MNLAEKVIVVTGAGNGMGREVALQLLSRGAKVAGVDLNRDGLEETARLAGASSALTLHPTDVTRLDDVGALPSEVVAAHGQVDGLVNIAGIIHRFVPFAELTPVEAERVLAVNFWGTVNTCRAFLPYLMDRPSSVLVNMSSLSALVPFAGQTFYGASKGAVKQFSEGLYAELHGTNVHVSTIFPGNISTNLTGNSGVEMISAGGRKVRATTPADAGRQIVTGIERGRFRILVGADAHLLSRLARVAAGATTRFVAAQMKSVMSFTPSRSTR